MKHVASVLVLLVPAQVLPKLVPDMDYVMVMARNNRVLVNVLAVTVGKVTIVPNCIVPKDVNMGRFVYNIEFRC